LLSKDWATLVSYTVNANTYGVALGAYLLFIENRLNMLSFIFDLLYLAVLPLLPIFIGYFKGETDLFVSKKEQRLKYFIIAVGSYSLGYFYYKLVAYDLLMTYFLFNYVIVTSAIMIVTKRWKASVHLCGLAGPTTFLALNLSVVYSLLYLILIPVYKARYELHAHTNYELILGALIGVTFTLLAALTVWAYPIIISSG